MPPRTSGLRPSRRGGSEAMSGEASGLRPTGCYDRREGRCLTRWSSISLYFLDCSNARRRITGRKRFLQDPIVEVLIGLLLSIQLQQPPTGHHGSQRSGIAFLELRIFVFERFTYPGTACTGQNTDHSHSLVEIRTPCQQGSHHLIDISSIQ